MCLTKANLIKPTKDLVCYKILRKGVVPNFFSSPYFGYLYKLGLLEKKYPVKIPGYKNPFTNETTIEGDAFHSFKTLQGAKRVKQYVNYSEDYVIVKCIIPKDSTYIYEGIFVISSYSKPVRKYVSYASQKIIPVSVIE